MKDLHSNIKTSPVINPAAAITGNGTTTGATIDRDGYDSLEFAIQSGAITDGTMTGTMYHGDQSNMSDEAAVGAGDVIGTVPVFAATDDNVCKRVGYKGGKRYVRIKFVGSGQTSGGFFAGQAIQGNPVYGPVP